MSSGLIKPAIVTKMVSGLVLGATVGGMVGALRGFMTQPGYAERLTPKPECFDQDPNAAKLFYEFGKYRHLDEASYKEALHNTDSLFCLEKQLQLGEVQPQLTDAPTATQYAVRTLTHLRRIQDMTSDDLQHEDVTDKIKEMEEILESHVRNVRLICKNL